MIYRTSQEKIAEYYSKQFISQSELKLLAKGTDFYLMNKEKLLKSDKYFDEPADHFIIGSAVDCMVTEGEEVFKQKYYVSNLTSKPSDTLISIMRYVFDKLVANDIPANADGTVTIDATTVFPLASYPTYILEACELEKYQPRYGADAKINAVTKDTVDYWNEMISSVGQQIITLEQKVLIQRIAKSFEALLMNYILDNDVDIFFQFPVYGDLRLSSDFKIPSKGLIDMLIVNHLTCSITIIDFKTMSDSVIDFHKSMKRRRYDIQIAYYNDLVNYLINKGALASMLYNNYSDSGLEFSKVEDIHGYHLGRPEFWVQSTVYDNNPVMYVCNDDIIQIGRNGKPQGQIPVSYSNDSLSTVPTEKVIGYNELLDNYIKVVLNNYTRHPESFFLSWNVVEPYV